MMIQSDALTLVAYVYDGLFKGGIIVMVAEISAESGYPVGESITFGLLTALEHGFSFIILITMALLVGPLKPRDEQRELKTKFMPFYIFLLATYAIMTLTSTYITFKNEPVLHRYIEDKVNPYEEEENNQEQEKKNEKINVTDSHAEHNTTSESFQMTEE